LVPARRDDAAIEHVVMVVDRLEGQVDALSSDAPRRHEVRGVVFPDELFADLVNAPVDADGVLRRWRADGPLPAELQPDLVAVGRPASRTPVPQRVVRPAASAV